MTEPPTTVSLPSYLPFPIKIVSLDTKPDENVSRGARLLSYSFTHVSKDPKVPPEMRFGTWDSTLDGTLVSWHVKVGDVISARRARERVVEIREPCKHGMQVGGLCVICGKDMTNTDYTGFSDASRASIQMTHSAFGPTVSYEEAQRIERETAQHLLNSRRLSLIVDLDQTIVHATVDPTVGEWIAQGEAWEKGMAEREERIRDREERKALREERKRQKELKGADDDDDDDDDSSDDSSDDSDDSDEEEEPPSPNPNWAALKDVKKFRLGPESLLSPNAKGKHKLIEAQGCTYFVKPRPGWEQFFSSMASKYEMHVYTMGTRAYAEEVCAAIDPDKKIFGGRILSRDESGSLTQKSLQRLFPCDTSMVVIIDDRADVWGWSPNLVKVIPYDFFVGIGDINSTFLPKVEPLVPSSQLRQSASASNGTSDMEQNTQVLEAQLEERPLAKKQEELEHPSSETTPTTTPPPETSSSTSSSVEGPSTSSASTPPSAEKEETTSTTHLAKKALLNNNDSELVRVGNILDTIHSQFFTAYESASSPELSSSFSLKKRPFDVTRIIPSLRSSVFEGVTILFSSVIPLDTPPETTEVYRLARMFGARVEMELGKDVTHVVAAKKGTVKVDMARKRGAGIKIVWLAWFTDSVALWERQDEAKYLLDEPVPPPPPAPSTSSTQPQADGETGNERSTTPSMEEDEEDDPEDWEDASKSKGLHLEEINWDDINDEVEAAMNESDDDDEDEDEDRGDDNADGDGDSVSGDMYDDDMKSATHSRTPSISGPRRMKRKRSSTPSSATLAVPEGDADLLRSPLSKRKKLALERSGSSRLKEGYAASNDDAVSVAGSAAGTDCEEEEEDFLLGAFEEEEEEDAGES